MTRVFNDFCFNLRNFSTTFAVGLSGGYKVSLEISLLRKRDQNPSFIDTTVNAILFKHRRAWINLFSKRLNTTYIGKAGAMLQ